MESNYDVMCIYANFWTRLPIIVVILGFTKE
jgi:hypothetical protein